jgi:hypothetical protein
MIRRASIGDLLSVAFVFSMLTIVMVGDASQACAPGIHAPDCYWEFGVPENDPIDELWFFPTTDGVTPDPDCPNLVVGDGGPWLFEDVFVAPDGEEYP